MPSSTARIRKQLRPLHVAPAPLRGHLLAGVVHLGAIAACIAAWVGGWWPVSVLLWLAIAWMDHAALSRLHEAAHHLLARTPVINELFGVMIGTFALTPLSVYRYVHTQHHAHLGREKDPEFWPYNLPSSSRLLRLTYAWLELWFGWIFTPILYSLRTASAWPKLAVIRRHRLLLEWVALLLFWSVCLWLIHATGTWEWFVVGHLVPTWIAGSAQTVRKFTEHLGRFGETVYDMTRTVVYTQWVGSAASRSQLHVEHHGTHHRWPKIPYHKLPDATPVAYDGHEQGRIYQSHWAAIRDMLPHLLNPRVGPQWKQKLNA
jgi:fatty acid desaturase